MKIQFNLNFKTVEFDGFGKETGVNCLRSQLNLIYNKPHRKTT